MKSTRHDFDYVIVGAGTAGCVLAHRLSQDPAVRVALIEAGGPDGDWRLNLPCGVATVMNAPKFNWGYLTEPEPQLDGRCIAWPRGRVLGGSSSINGMIYVRGQPQDFDAWAGAGATGWSWAELLPYFKRIEDHPRGASTHHGADGPLQVSERPNRHPLWDDFIRAAMALGVPYNDDFNGPIQEGVGYYQATVRHGLRSSASRAYLRPALRRPNLRVLTGALAQRVLIDKGRARGVVVRQGQEMQTLHADAEVLLAGGAINSPQLLMLSGIGPADALQAMDIRVEADLPGVGANLQDHLQVRSVYRVKSPVTLNDQWHSWGGRLGALLEYLAWRRGPMAFPTAQIGLFTRGTPQAERPDLQVHFNNFSIDPTTAVPHRFPGMTLSVCQLRPQSRGRIALRSNDPAVAPRIHANYLADGADAQAMVQAVQLTHALTSQPSLARWIEAEHEPFDKASPAAALAHVRRTASSIYHPVGTCRMGSDALAVVSPTLKVHGIEALRVIDASVMPTIPSGNTNAAAFVIGEKGADLVRQ